MRIAVAYENGQIFQHFGRTEQFKFYDIAGGNMGSADEEVKAFLANELAQNSIPTCDHHGHGEGHTCGNHRRKRYQ